MIIASLLMVLVRFMREYRILDASSGCPLLAQCHLLSTRLGLFALVQAVLL